MTLRILLETELASERYNWGHQMICRNLILKTKSWNHSDLLVKLLDVRALVSSITIAAVRCTNRGRSRNRSRDGCRRVAFGSLLLLCRFRLHFDCWVLSRSSSHLHNTRLKVFKLGLLIEVRPWDAVFPFVEDERENL